MQTPEVKRPSNDRRIPKQKRSKEKVEKILNCAAELIAENGVENVNTHAVAAKAGIAVGSLYQFFPNIELVKIALAERVMNKLYLTIIDTLEQSESKQLADLTYEMIDAILGFYEQNQDTVRTILSSRNSEAFIVVNDKINERIIDALVTHIRKQDKEISESDLRRKAIVSIGFTDVMMILVWSTEDPKERNALVSEWKLLARIYAESIHITP